jgi:hypothetical protein
MPKVIIQTYNQLLKNGVNSFRIKQLHKNLTIRMLDTGYWMLEKRVARATQALAPRVALLIIKSTEYLINPVSSILVDYWCCVFVQIIWLNYKRNDYV